MRPDGRPESDIRDPSAPVPPPADQEHARLVSLSALLADLLRAAPHHQRPATLRPGGPEAPMTMVREPRDPGLLRRVGREYRRLRRDQAPNHAHLTMRMTRRAAWSSAWHRRGNLL